MDFKEATNLLSVPLERIAAELGKSYGTVLAYRTGDRVPPADVRQKLAAFMRAQAEQLAEAASNMENS